MQSASQAISTASHDNVGAGGLVAKLLMDTVSLYRVNVQHEGEFGSDLLGQHVNDVARVNEVAGRP
jgi:hypothetical protein